MQYNGKNLKRVITEHNKPHGSKAIFNDIVSMYDNTFSNNPSAISNCNLVDACFERCTFSNMTFVKVVFSQSTFKNVAFTNCVFEHCAFDGAIFYHCFFTNVKFIKSVGKYSADYMHCSFDNIIEDEYFYGNNLSSIIPISCPDTGSFTGWKVAYYYNSNKGSSIIPAIDYCLVKLQIPASAKRSSSNGLKCRCSEAKVLGFYDFNDNKLPDNIEVWSIFDDSFHYAVGETVKPTLRFDENRFNECAPGIHFFITKLAAKRYAAC